MQFLCPISFILFPLLHPRCWALVVYMITYWALRRGQDSSDQLLKMGSIVMDPYDTVFCGRIYILGHNYSLIYLLIGMVNSRGIFHVTNPFDYTVPLLVQLYLASVVILLTSSFIKRQFLQIAQFNISKCRINFREE